MYYFEYFFSIKNKNKEALNVSALSVCVCVCASAAVSSVIECCHAESALRGVKSLYFPVVMLPKAMQSDQDCIVPPAGRKLALQFSRQHTECSVNKL